ncbi:MAG TPA: efflux RND transporter periplasmic adaptor subunit [Acetobacteraceae bacterium]|nr:efflux RND transporter periplasmic adaptor subunit [Acetobacteraceae bacterium]
MRLPRSALFAALVIIPLVGWLSLSRGAVNAQAPSPAPAVPVTAAAAKVQDVPVDLRGLGTVQAFNTVQIRAQVNGTLIAIPVKEGDEVHQGDVVAQIDPRPYQAALDQATAKRAEDAAQLQSAQLDLGRYQDLAKRQFAPVQQVDDQKATVNKLVATIQEDTAAIETAQINLDYCTIHAPFDGRVSFHQTDIGNVVQTSSQTGIVSITQDKPISAVFTLPESELRRIQRAMVNGKLPVAAYDGDDRTKLAEGQLLTPNNAIDVSTGTIQLKATFDNTDDALWPGEFINARLRVDTLHQAVTIPIPAIQHGPNGLYVFIMQPDQTVRQADVQVAYQNDDVAVIAKGVNGGDSVVVGGQARLAPGVRVNTNAPAEDKAGATPPA